MLNQLHKGLELRILGSSLSLEGVDFGEQAVYLLFVVPERCKDELILDFSRHIGS
jgi:hypothetical protein